MCGVRAAPNKDRTSWVEWVVKVLCEELDRLCSELGAVQTVEWTRRAALLDMAEHIRPTREDAFTFPRVQLHQELRRVVRVRVVRSTSGTLCYALRDG